MISRIHYISQGATPEEHLLNIKRMLSAGAGWIQLRLKNESSNAVLETARAAKELCDAHSAILIINDFPTIAKEVDAHGVHLGKQDSCPLAAREILGQEKIVGGTANTLADCSLLIQKQVDYIGLGPFRFTTTKANLSPVLGIQGFREIISSLDSHVPVIGIGGIEVNDIAALKEAGVHGVAVSGALTSHQNPAKFFNQIEQQLTENIL